MGAITDHDFNSQELGNTVWAFSKVDRESPVLFDAIAHVAEPCLKDWNSQELANTVWAFATANHASPFLLAAKS